MKDDALIEQILAEDEQEVVDNENIAEDKQEEVEALEDTAMVGEAVEEVSEPIQEVQVPDNWEPSLKDFVAGIEDLNGKKAIIDKLSNFEKGYQGKFQSLSDERKSFEEERNSFAHDRKVVESYTQLEANFSPEVSEQIKSSFGGTPQYFNYLMDMDKQASQDPATFLLNISNSNGIDLAQLAEMQKSPAVQQNYQAQQQQQAQKQTYDNKLAELEKMISSKFEEQDNNRFLNELKIMKDESGNLKYPHISNDNVIQSMDYLSQRNPDADIDTLYKESLYMVPDIRESILNQNNTIAQKTIEAKQALAPKQVKSSVSSSNTKQKMSDSELIDNILEDFA